MYGVGAAHSILAMAHRSQRNIRPESALYDACRRAGVRRDVTLCYIAIKLVVPGDIPLDDRNRACMALSSPADDIEKAEAAMCELLSRCERIGSIGVF